MPALAPAVLLVAGVTLAACSGGGTPAPSPPPAVASPAGASSDGGTPRDVECVAGEAHLRTPFAPAADDLTVGAVSWPGLRAWAAGKPAGLAGEGGPDFKIGVAVRAGATVTVAVEDDDGGAVGLNYGQAWGYTPARAVGAAAGFEG